MRSDQFFNYTTLTIEEIETTIESFQKKEVAANYLQTIISQNFDVNIRKFCFYKLGKLYLYDLYNYFKSYYYLNELVNVDSEVQYPDAGHTLDVCKSKLSSIY